MADKSGLVHQFPEDTAVKPASGGVAGQPQTVRYHAATFNTFLLLINQRQQNRAETCVPFSYSDVRTVEHPPLTRRGVVRYAASACCLSRAISA